LGQSISVASDIYSLGVLLFVLLSGEHPYEMADVSTGELLRVVCGVQPPRPSAKSCPFGKIDADLDSIVLKALRKDPKDRYVSAQDLATDIQAYLDHRPVQARKGNLRYVAGKFAQRNKLALASAFLVLAAIVAGIAGVAWQSHLANEQRRKAEARSADLRELSSSLLSELAQALRDIPGTTGAQKILVTNVLAHLDRMAKDAQGDRQTALDLIDAYTQLGNIQGNVYDQNVGDTASAVATFDRAIALAATMARAHPDDRDLLRAEAAALEAKGESISQFGDAQASVAALQAAVQLYDRVVALPGVTAALIFEAAIAYETLGNEEAEDSGLADAPVGMAAYRHALEMDERALRLDPDFVRVRRGIPLMHIHIGNVILETEPNQALGEFKLAQQLQEALPEQERAKLPQVRMHGLVLRKIGQAYAEMGRYEEAQESFSQARPVLEGLVDADPKNVGALSDLWRLQAAEALTDAEAGNGDLSSLDAAAQRNHRRAALATYQFEADTIRRIIKLSPSHAEWDQALASVQIQLGALKHELGLPLDSVVATERSLKILVQAATAPHAAAGDIDAAVTAELQVEPDTLRDPVLTLRLAEKGVEMTHHRATGYLLLLAKAYRANGNVARAMQAAREGLALLPPNRAGSPSVRVRTLLALQLAEPITKNN
jgi:tetratricopeptide (TPR) repeat protein